MRRAVLATLLAMLPANVAFARQAALPQTTWEVGGYGGLSVLRMPAGGAPTLPLPGPPLPTTSPLFPTRQVPSWFFGDGAELLNNVLSAFGLNARITPLDAALGSFASESTARAAGGLRIGRGLTTQYALEASVDVVPGSSAVPSGLVAAADVSRETFVNAISTLLASGPFSSPDVGATVVSRGASGPDVAVTGALELRFAQARSLQPYALAGAGAVFPVGDDATLALEGRYRTRIAGVVPIDETDRVTVREARRASAVAIVGGGVRRGFSDRWGLRFDARLLVGRRATSLEVDAAPSVLEGSPAGFIESGTSPSVQFSNSPTTGRTSSLSGQLQSFEVLRGTGLATRVLITVGVFWR